MRCHDHTNSHHDHMKGLGFEVAKVTHAEIPILLVFSKINTLQIVPTLQDCISVPRYSKNFLEARKYL